jgi:hypothetical protein
MVSRIFSAMFWLQIITLSSYLRALSKYLSITISASLFQCKVFHYHSTISLQQYGIFQLSSYLIVFTSGFHSARWHHRPSSNVWAPARRFVSTTPNTNTTAVTAVFVAVTTSPLKEKLQSPLLLPPSLALRPIQALLLPSWLLWTNLNSNVCKFKYSSSSKLSQQSPSSSSSRTATSSKPLKQLRVSFNCSDVDTDEISEIMFEMGVLSVSVEVRLPQLSLRLVCKCIENDRDQLQSSIELVSYLKYQVATSSCTISHTEHTLTCIRTHTYITKRIHT